MKNEVSWDDLKLFLDVARLGGLTPATATTSLSAATLGRRVAALERQMGQALFTRSQTGYRLTAAGEDLLSRAEDVEAAMHTLIRWREGAQGERIVRISAGTWTTQFLARNIDRLWRVGEGIGIEFVTSAQRVDIGRRNADIGIRNARPSEQWLAGRQIGKVAHALYSGSQLINGVAAGFFVGVVGEAANTPSARWLAAHHGDRIVIRGNDALSVAELVAAGAGLGIFPCFGADVDPRLIRVAPPIAELTSEQWLVTHHEERHTREVRIVADRIAALVHENQPLFAGQMPHRRASERGPATPVPKSI